MPAGRKSLREEIGIVRRYADLTEPYFKFIAEMIAPESPLENRKWAAERLDKAFPKFIPQKLEGDGEDGGLVIKVITFANNDTSQLPATGLPVGVSESTAEIQDRSISPESGQIEISPERADSQDTNN